MAKKIKIPEYDGEFVHIYNPSGDVYNGVKTESFTPGEYYGEWITNDFSVLKDGNTWHIIGITHPRPRGFINDFEYSDDIHEAEYQAFHCTAEGENFSDIVAHEAFKDCDKILYPQERENERPEFWAPHLMKYDGKYNVIYSPEKMRRAVSTDFKHWEIMPSLFTCENPAARDPYLFEEDGKIYAVFTEERQLKYRVSENMTDWSDVKVLQSSFYDSCECESPFLMKREGVYYLFWSICDGRNGSYDNRTLVFAADTIDGLKDTAPITMLKAHAPEIVTDADGESWLLSTFYPNNGISAVKLKWI